MMQISILKGYGGKYNSVSFGKLSDAGMSPQETMEIAEAGDYRIEAMAMVDGKLRREQINLKIGSVMTDEDVKCVFYPCRFGRRIGNFTVVLKGCVEASGWVIEGAEGRYVAYKGGYRIVDMNVKKLVETKVLEQARRIAK